MEKMDLDLVFQVSVCVDDMDSELDCWRKYFKLNEDSIIRKSTQEIYERGEYHCGNYMGRPCEYFHKYYRFDLGGLDFEMIEPITRTPGNPYSDFLAKGGNGIHHLGVKLRDRHRLVKNMEELGIPVMTYAYQGPRTNDVQARSDCYFYDLRQMLGVVIEAGGAVVGPLAGDARAGDQSALARLNSYAARPQLQAVEVDSRIERMEIKRIRRIGICVEDAAAVIHNWQKYFNIDAAAINCPDKGRRRFMLGGIEVELIEPAVREPGDFCFDFLRENGGNGIHHVAIETDDKAKLMHNMDILGIVPFGQDRRCYDLKQMLGMMLVIEG